MEDRQRTTKSIFDNYSGDVLDVPNAEKKILDMNCKKLKRCK